MGDLKYSVGCTCLVSRIDYNQLPEESKREIEPYYDALQDAVDKINLVSKPNGTSIELNIFNLFVEESGKNLWYGIHDLISPNATCYVEIHNFDINGNTLDVEKYIVDEVVLNITKDCQHDNIQIIHLVGRISEEIKIDA